MITNRVFAAALTIVSLVSMSWAASPAQVGAWSGISKVTTFTGGTNRTVTKETMQIEIAADNTTTITVGGVQQVGGALFFNETYLLLNYGPPPGSSAIYFSTLGVKNTTMKGSGVGYTLGVSGLINTIEAKYKLKKQ